MNKYIYLPAALFTIHILALHSFALSSVRIPKTPDIIAVPRTAKAPQIDGKLEEDIWAKAAKVSLVNISGRTLNNPTEARLLYDDQSLYLGFECHDRQMDKLRAFWIHKEERDNRISDDDCVGVYLDPFNNGRDYYQVIVNAGNVIYDAVGDDANWFCGVNSAVEKTAATWTVEMAIPFKDIDYKPQSGDWLRINLCRDQKADGEKSGLFVSGKGFGDLSRFPVINFDGVKRFARPVKKELKATFRKKPDRIWVSPKKPLYKELFSDEPLGPGNRFSIYWAHNTWRANECRTMAAQLGIPYLLNEEYREIGELGMVCIMGIDRQTSRKYNIKRLAGVDYGINKPQGKTVKVSFLADPEAAEKWKECALNRLNDEKYSELWGIFGNDELIEIQTRVGVELFQSEKTNYPFMVQADQEIKTKYGGGKWGIPESGNDPVPYRWIAYRRWLDDKFGEISRRTWEAVKTKNPDIYLVSWNTQGCERPTDYSLWKFDIVNQQTIQAHPLPAHGFLTKLVTDISGARDFWPCMHLERYANSFTPEEVLEQMSQVIRNGGTGFHIYLMDVQGRSLTNGPFFVSDKFGAPDRWQVITSVLQEMKNVRRLKFPRPDFAVLYSVIENMAQPGSFGTWSGKERAAYFILGPRCGSWFKFISDGQIEREEVNLDEYKAIYVPAAKYEDPAVVQALHDYVIQGGTLIMADQDVFREDPAGNPLDEWRAELFADAKPENITKLFVVPAGSPYVAYEKSLGNGKTLFFAESPFRSHELAFREADTMESIFRTIHEKLGIKLDHDIWRFQFPKSLINPLPKPTGWCLTGNYVFWQQSQAKLINNQDTGGDYQYSLGPDDIPDVTTNGPIPFTRGKLTDRPVAIRSPSAISAYRAPSAVSGGLSKLEDWIVRFAADNPFEITFDLKKNYPVNKAVIYFSGELPILSLQGSNDGKKWKTLGTTKSADEVGADVKATCLTCEKNGDFRHIKLCFGARSPGQKLTLAEIEIWTP